MSRYRFKAEFVTLVSLKVPSGMGVHHSAESPPTVATSLCNTLLMKLGPSVSRMYNPQSLANEQRESASTEDSDRIRRRREQPPAPPTPDGNPASSPRRFLLGLRWKERLRSLETCLFKQGGRKILKSSLQD